jgi:hypothetical protein
MNRFILRKKDCPNKPDVTFDRYHLNQARARITVLPGPSPKICVTRPEPEHLCYEARARTSVLPGPSPNICYQAPARKSVLPGPSSNIRVTRPEPENLCYQARARTSVLPGPSPNICAPRPRPRPRPELEHLCYQARARTSVLPGPSPNICTTRPELEHLCYQAQARADLCLNFWIRLRCVVSFTHRLLYSPTGGSLSPTVGVDVVTEVHTGCFCSKIICKTASWKTGNEMWENTEIGLR